MFETPDHRERRLLQLAEAIEPHLDQGWLFLLVIGKPEDRESVNVVSNIPFPEQVVELLQVIIDRHAAGGKAQKL
jgi:hypothetical protein